MLKYKLALNIERVRIMAIDWGEAVRIGGMGFGVVFVVLVILSIVIWLTGLVTGKIVTSKDKTNDRKKGA